MLKVDKFSNTFSAIYDKDIWTGGSGPGSYEENTVEYRKILQRFFDESKIKTIVDLGCGDWQIMRHITIHGYQFYIGLDIVKSVIEQNKKKYSKNNISFHCINAINNKLPKGDLLIVKEVLQHWDLSSIQLFIERILPRYKQVLITNKISDYDPIKQALYNQDIPIGEFRPTDLSAPPFNIPMQIIANYAAPGGCMQVCLYKNKKLRLKHFVINLLRSFNNLVVSLKFWNQNKVKSEITIN